MLAAASIVLKPQRRAVSLIDGTEPSPLYLDAHLGHQLWILIVVAVSMIPYFMSFDLPKQIVNGPIQGKRLRAAGRDPDLHEPALRPAVHRPGRVVLRAFSSTAPGDAVCAEPACSCLLVIINGLFKFYINTYKGRLGERMLRRIRFELVDRVLRFPPDVLQAGEGRRSRDHGQGRGGAARRLHRRCLRAAGAARRPGADGAALHHGPEFLARHDRGRDRRRSRSCSSRACAGG